jgi:hypothetical protein
VRQGQQNRRGRGRNRKSQNPLARSFESNGPDVKIRGTPAHIAEKYISLARDAQSSGDPVLAENYLQHAEHYSRIIMAYREQMHQAGEGYNGNGQQRLRGPNDGLEGGDDFADDDGDDLLDDSFPQPTFQSPPQHTQGHQQPRQHGGYDNNRHDRPFRRDHGRFRDRDRNQDRERHNDRERGDRQPFESRPQPPVERAEPAAEAGQGPAAAPEQQRPAAPEQQRPAAPEPQPAREQQPPRRRERFQPQAHEQPEFLRRPVRRAARNEEETPEANGKEEPSRD